MCAKSVQAPLSLTIGHDECYFLLVYTCNIIVKELLSWAKPFQIEITMEMFSNGRVKAICERIRYKPD